MRFAIALFGFTTLAITGLALGSSARETSLERTEQQLLDRVDLQLAQRLSRLSAAK